LQPSKSNLTICQNWPSVIPTWISGATEVQLMRNQLFWIPDSKVYKRSKFTQKTMSYKGYMIFQRWQLNSVSKQVSWRNEIKLRSEASKQISKFLFQQFIPIMKEILEVWRRFAGFVWIFYPIMLQEMDALEVKRPRNLKVLMVRVGCEEGSINSWGTQI